MKEEERRDGLKGTRLCTYAWGRASGIDKMQDRPHREQGSRAIIVCLSLVQVRYFDWKGKPTPAWSSLEFKERFFQSY